MKIDKRIEINCRDNDSPYEGGYYIIAIEIQGGEARLTLSNGEYRQTVDVQVKKGELFDGLSALKVLDGLGGDE